jgi:hypothetical protein
VSASVTAVNGYISSNKSNASLSVSAAVALENPVTALSALTCLRGIYNDAM